MKKFNFSSKRGFTLIELLVVIGILAVLAAIAIPMVSGVIMKANVSADKTNSNEMTNSMERFASEYELYCQDIAAGKIKNTANLDSAQARVYNVTKATTRSDIEKLESEDGFNGRAIDGDTNYPTNRETAQAVIQTYEKTLSSTFEPKQSDAHYYYSPDCGVVVVQDTEKASVTSLNSLVSSGVGISGQKLDTNTVWIDLTKDIELPANTPASCGIEGHYIGDDKGEHGIPVENCKSGHTYTCECDCWIVPDGGKYYVGVTSTTLGDYTGAKKIYNAGEKLPCGYVAQTGDTYVDECYEYRYNNYYHSAKWYKFTYQNGWGIRVISNAKTSYGEIFESITNRPITSMRSTFSGCKSLQTAPTIPSNVTEMDSTFSSCESLQTAPTIPSSVTDMASTFSSCKSLTTPPDMSKATSVKSMGWTFLNCTSLTTAPTIPNSVTDMKWTFENCTSLTTPPDMSNATSVTNMEYTFKGCTSLTTAPVIPNKVTNMERTFSNCKSLTTAPVIPNSVTDMSSTFENCTSLTTPPDMSKATSVTNMERTFYRCKSLTTPPDMSKATSVTNMDSTFYRCTSLTTAPVIPNSVTDMSSTFKGCTSLTTPPDMSKATSVTIMWNTFDGCTSLTGTITINANPTSYRDCFSGIDFETNNITLTGTSTMLDTLGATGNNYCSTCNGICKGTH